MNLFWKKVWNIATNVIVSIVVVIAILLAGARLLGLQVYTVLSGSMEPEYHTGSVIYVKSVDAEDIKINDPITFVMDESLVVATHRVINIDNENRLFYTKGDANEIADISPVPFENLIGKPIFTIPLLGYLANFIQNPPGIYISIGLAALLIVACFVPDIIDMMKKPSDKSEETDVEPADEESVVADAQEMSNDELLKKILDDMSKKKD